MKEAYVIIPSLIADKVALVIESKSSSKALSPKSEKENCFVLLSRFNPNNARRNFFPFERIIDGSICASTTSKPLVCRTIFQPSNVCVKPSPRAVLRNLFTLVSNKLGSVMTISEFNRNPSSAKQRLVSSNNCVGC